MTEDIEGVKKIIAEKGLKTVEEVNKVIREEVRSLPSFEVNEKKIIQVRGSILESAIRVEAVFNEIIKLSNKPEKIDEPFRSKAKFIENLIKEIVPKNKDFNKNFFDKFQNFVTIRNLFAHVPTNPFSEKIEFEYQDQYEVFYKGDLSRKDTSKTCKEFVEIGKEILAKMLLFMSIIAERMGVPLK